MYKNKNIINNMNREMNNLTADKLEKIINTYYSKSIIWNISEPFNKLEGKKEILDKFWIPLFNAIPDLKKETYVLLEGKEPIKKEREWVLSSGNFIGNFMNDWLGIPATKGCIWMRYMEYNRLENGKIVESYILVDIVDLMKQAGFNIVESLGNVINVPGPSTYDGVNLKEQNATLTEHSYNTIFDLSWKSLDKFKDTGLGKMGIDQYFDKDFMWYGPTGIGSMRSIKGFEKFHQIPFLKALPDRRYPTVDKEGIFFADNNYCTYIWWDHFKATHSGDGWLGLKATNNPLNMRCSDIYRIENNMIQENWVMLDMIDIFKQLGVDVFKKLEELKQMA